MKVRVGMEGGRRAVLEEARRLGAPILVSANSLWSAKRGEFRGWEVYGGHDCALDSGGFVAMMKYGGYRWSVAQYAGLAAAMRPAWWAQMDFCCEPQLAAKRSEVFRRIDRTAEHLRECQAAALAAGTSAPMPVLQGWEAADYCQGPIFAAGYVWPELVGVGSVCRRSVGGAAGVLAIVGALDRAVPRHVKFHLFGVKSGALGRLRECFPRRIASVDSMAWNIGGWWDNLKTGGGSYDSTARAGAMAKWYTKQMQVERQKLLNLC